MMSRASTRPWGYLAAELVAFWPSAAWFYSRTRYASEERWQLVALVAAVVLLVIRSREPRRPDAKPSSSMLGPALGVVVYAAMVSFVPPLFAALVAVSVLTWTASHLLIGRRFDLALFSLGLLALPVVQVFQYHLGLPLRIVTASGANALLQLVGLDVVRHGTCLDWQGVLVWVDPPCSGLRMLWTTLFLAALASALWKLSTRRTLVV